MIIKLDRKELDAARSVCFAMDYKLDVFTIENNDNMIQVEITWTLGELSSELAYSFGRILQLEIENRNDKVRAKKWF